jgi:hypothetical protein
MPRPAVYHGDLAELLRNYKGQYADATGECARLPQVLTDVGWTGRWMRGARVLDSPHLAPGTVIANFVLKNGRWVYPNQKHYHAALFHRFEGRRPMGNGLPCEFSTIDQWQGHHVSERGMAILPESWKRTNPDFYTPANRADEFYVVLVP